jgi:hypothetical protein
MDNEVTTTTPVAPSIGAPEFVNTDGMLAVFGIKRSLAYDLLGQGKIRGVSLRRQGKQRGKRLFVAQSVRDYLHSLEGEDQ